MTVATDRIGRLLVKYNVLTICPIEYAAEARQIAAEFVGESAESMLNLNLRAVGTDSVTHVGCLRQAWSDEVIRQAAFMSRNLPWIDAIIRRPSRGISPKFCMFASPADAPESILQQLELEVA